MASVNYVEYRTSCLTYFMWMHLLIDAQIQCWFGESLFVKAARRYRLTFRCAWCLFSRSRRTLRRTSHQTSHTADAHSSPSRAQCVFNDFNVWSILYFWNCYTVCAIMLYWRDSHGEFIAPTLGYILYWTAHGVTLHAVIMDSTVCVD